MERRITQLPRVSNRRRALAATDTLARLRPASRVEMEPVDGANPPRWDVVEYRPWQDVAPPRRTSGGCRT